MNTQMADFTPQSLVRLEEGKALTSSLIVAEIFDKEHKNVLQRIERLECSPEFTELNFQPSTYVDSSGRSLPAYYLTRDGFVFLVMGFNGKKAAAWKEKFLEAFNAMEKALLEKSHPATQDVPHHTQDVKAKIPVQTVSPRQFTPASPAKIQGIRGLIRLLAAIEDCPQDELESKFLDNYDFSSFAFVQDWDTDEMEWTLIKRLFRATGDITVGSTAPEDRVVLDGLLDFGVALRGFSRSHLEGVIGMLCNVPDTGHLSAKGIRKATFALWSFLNRYPVRRDCLSEAMYAVTKAN